MAGTLKDLIAADVDRVFFELDDFAELHRIEGKEISIVIDNDQLEKMKQGQILGVAESDMLIFAKTSDMPKRKAPGSLLNVDGRELIVDEWTENKGVTQIALRQNRTV
ncbi:MAG: hypothetical protein IJ680_07720 [Paludibacteraceae bacterium]|nr:sugar ABC transporter ATP-binding protein [Eubacterium sp.]MBR1631729.1 hypothetical protein [Paludibacteraceae bacterium]